MQDNFNENQKDSFQNKIKIFDWFKSSFLHPTTYSQQVNRKLFKNVIIKVVILFITVAIIDYFFNNVEIIEIKQHLSATRIQPKATLMCENRVLITGGYSSFDSFSRLKSTEIFDINSKKMFSGPNLNLSHGENYNQFLLPNCEVVVIDEKGIEIYNPTKNIFELVEKNLNSINIKYQDEDYTNYTLLKDGNILITGGQDVFEISKNKIKRYPISKSHIFNTKTKKIKTIQNLPIPLMKHSSYINQKGDVYIVGGLTLNDKNKIVCNTQIIKYDKNAEIFSIIGKNDKINLTYYSKIYEVEDNEIVLIGGTSSNHDCDKISKMNINNFKYSDLYKTNYKPFPKNDAIFKTGNNIYFINYTSFPNKIDIFNLDNNKMKHKIVKKIPYGCTILQVSANNFLLVGGENNLKIYIIKIKEK